MADSFNQLSAAESERLAVVAEECAEVAQIVMKILRHGYESDNNGKLPHTNREALEQEIGDLFYALDMLFNAGDIRASGVKIGTYKKALRVGEFLHSQG